MTVYSSKRSKWHSILVSSACGIQMNCITKMTISCPGSMILKDQILLTPNGVMSVPSKVQRGILPRLLEEILSTRIMVKQAMEKLSPSEQVLQRIFNARQLALKLTSNVTYGYTAAGFTGRMPCAELADSIVQHRRCTLEKAISLTVFYSSS
ncbi:DNA polymerase zeta [Lathyrus oleraceus]|uniref:DNA polymerase zeta catalytic subunit n=1 Tax=Pisum sativum TaxID=3888 RepID=A0A9D4X157_PEA|nr:DNA polymerase zeta [Pisum sativum]